MMVLNEASLPFSSVEDCLDNLESFFDILHKTMAQSVSFSRVDEVEGNWNSLIYADGFSFGSWLNNNQDKDRLRQIQSVLSNVKCPSININDNQNNIPVSEMLFVLNSNQKIEVNGLGYASIIKATGLSFSSSTQWKSSLIPVLKSWDEFGQVNEEIVNVPNVCTLTQAEEFLASLEIEQQSKRDYFDTIKTKDNTDFPNLLFTESVLRTFRSASLSAQDYEKALQIMRSLNSAITTANGLSELNEITGLSISGESSQTMDNKKLARLRRFRHPELGNQIFEEHVKNFMNYKRMHILIDYEANKICIGYFGNHLKTSSE